MSSTPTPPVSNASGSSATASSGDRVILRTQQPPQTTQRAVITIEDDEVCTIPPHPSAAAKTDASSSGPRFNARGAHVHAGSIVVSATAASAASYASAAAAAASSAAVAVPSAPSHSAKRSRSRSTPADAASAALSSSDHTPRAAKMQRRQAPSPPCPLPARRGVAAAAFAVPANLAADAERVASLQRACVAWEASVQVRYSSEDALSIEGFLTRYSNVFAGFGDRNNVGSWQRAIAQDRDGRLQAEAKQGWELDKQLKLMYAKHPSLRVWHL